jgi:hypothetical protein
MASLGLGAICILDLGYLGFGLLWNEKGLLLTTLR